MEIVNNKPCLFLAFANDNENETRFLSSLAEESAKLQQALVPAQQAGLCEVLVRQNVSLDDIFQVFQDPDYQDRIVLFHYAGHANAYQLLLESNSGQVEAAHAEGLATLLGTQSNLKLVFLNGCATAPQVQGLLDAQVPSVIATNHLIDDEMATQFASRFYTGLAKGANVQLAFTQAKADVIARFGGQTRIGPIKGPSDDKKTHESKFQETVFDDHALPWQLYIKPGAEHLPQWSLPEAAGDPLFGLSALPHHDLPDTPYRHLNWFKEKHAELFFGRGLQIRQLLDRLTDEQHAPVLLLHGSSGVGKTSLITAGLLPRLSVNNQVNYIRRDFEKGLLGSVIGCFPTVSNELDLLDTWKVQETNKQQALFIILDQVEEVFTRLNPEIEHELTQLVKVIADIFANPQTRPKGKLILSFRKEWLPEIDQALGQYKIPHSAYFLAPLNKTGIIEAIEGPTRLPRLAQHYNLSIESGLASTIADTLLKDRDSPVAPVLQILLSKLWTAAKQQNYSSPTFDTTLYEQLEKQGLLLSDFLEQQIAIIKTQHPKAVESGLLLDLLAFFTTTHGTATEHAKEIIHTQYAHCEEQINSLVKSSIDNILLIEIPQNQQAQSKFRLVHDTLAPIIRARFEESDLPGQRARRILENRAVEWHNEQRGTPLDQRDLSLVENGLIGMRTWHQQEQKLIEASRTTQHQQMKRRKIWQGVGAIAVIIICVTAVIAIWQWNTAVIAKNSEQQQKIVANNQRDAAEEQKELAEQRQNELKQERDGLLAQNLFIASQTVYDQSYQSDLNLSANLLLESLSRARVPKAFQAWHETFKLIPDNITQLPISNYAEALKFSTTGKTLFIQFNKHVEVWNLPTLKHTHTFKSDSRIRFVDINFDNSLLAIAHDNKVDIWNIKKEQILTSFKTDNESIHSVTFNPLNNQLAVVSSNKTGSELGVYNLENIDNTIFNFNSPADIYTLKFSSDASKLAIRTSYAILIWETSSWDLLARLSQSQIIDDFQFSPNGLFVATASRDDFARIWDITNSKVINKLSHTDNSLKPIVAKDLNKLVFNSDGTKLATVGELGLLRVWDLESGLGLHRINRNASLGDVFFNNDNSILVTSDSSSSAKGVGSGIDPQFQTIRLWQASSGNLLKLLQVPFSFEPLKIQYNTIRNKLGFISSGKVFLWPLNEKDSFFFHLKNKEYKHVVFMDNDKTVATADFNGEVNIWNSNNGNLLKTLRLENQEKFEIENLSLTPNNNFLILLGKHEVITWDTKTWKGVSHFTRLGKSFSGNITPLRLIISPDEKSLTLYSFITSEDYTNIHLQWEQWDIIKGNLVSLHKKLVKRETAKLSKGGSYIAGIKKDDTFAIWDTSSGDEVFSAHDATFNVSAVFSLGETSVTYRPSKNSIEIWDFKHNKKVLHTSTEKVIKGFEISENGQYLIMRLDNNIIEARSIPSGRLLNQIQYKPKYFSAFTTDNNSYAIAGQSDNLWLWSFTKNSNPTKLEVLDQSMPSYTFSHDNRFALTSVLRGGNRQIKIWNLTTGQEYASIERNLAIGLDFPFFSPTDKWIGRRPFENRQFPIELYLWKTEDLISVGCSKLSNPLTEAQWQQYLGDAPYNPLCKF